MGMKRILLKLSGEALAGDKKTGFDEEKVRNVAGQIKKLSEDGKQISIVIGGGNFWRGRTSDNMDRVKADQIGMLATIMNCIYTADMLNQAGLKTHIMTHFACGSMTELFSKDKAIEYLEAGDIVFFAGGMGHPYFSTDTPAVLMAIETCSDIILMAKAIDGVYDSDPKLNKDAVKYDELLISEIIDKKLAVIDYSAAVLALENKMPMMLFGLDEEDSIIKTVTGKFTGTILKCN